MTGTRKREEIEARYRWKIEDIYDQEEKWEEDFKTVVKLGEEIEKYKGVLARSSQNLVEILELLERVQRKAEKVYVYAKMRLDEDNSNSYYQTLHDRAQGLNIKLGSITSFVTPEIIAIPDDKLSTYISENQGLDIYQHFFDELLRQKEHILSSAEEKLLAMAEDLTIVPRNVFTMLNNADIKFPSIIDEDGNEIEITKGRYGRFMESSDRRVRKEAFKGLYSTYNKLINTIGATLNSSVKKDIFYAQARKYPSALEASLDQDNVPVKVYENLIATVHNNLDAIYQYMDIRKKMLGIDELHMYDIYTPLVKDVKFDIPYEKAKELVIDALKPLGEEYLQVLTNGLNSGWVDVYENRGKTSGAYSWGAYDTHPYVLMNYDNKLDDVFTLAHEMGHAMHTYYSNKSQPFIYSQYSIFVAEVASTVNESLLIDYMLNNYADKDEKVYLLNHYLEQFRGTVYRQTMFAEFEKIIHETVENGGALNADVLSSLYRELNSLYYGPEVISDTEIDIEWARIPHFYSAFYVYKYATGFSAATAIKQMILENGQPAVDRYIEFLKSGSSDYSLNLLKKTGVDLTSPEPIRAALEYFAGLVKELEAM